MSDSTRIEAVSGLLIRARNPARSARWYGHVLGAPLMAAGPGMWTVHVGPLRVAVVPRPPEWYRESPPNIAVTLHVRDLDGLLASLRESGDVFIREELENEDGRFAMLLDPDGNEVALWEPLVDPDQPAVKRPPPTT